MKKAMTKKAMTKKALAMMSARARLAAYIRENGPIPTVRVSAARARGKASQYSYWGAVRYEIDLSSRDGFPVHRPKERATSDRRSFHLAREDAMEIASKEWRLTLDRGPGLLTEEECADVLRNVEELNLARAQFG